jgi:hypothetical protein
MQLWFWLDRDVWESVAGIGETLGDAKPVPPPTTTYLSVIERGQRNPALENLSAMTTRRPSIWPESGGERRSSLR